MTQKIKKIISEFTGIDYSSIRSDMLIEDDLHMNEYDIEDLLEEVEIEFNVEFEDKNRDFIYISDLIVFIKESI